MPWIQVSVTISDSSYQRVEDALLALGAQSVTLRDAADHPILEPRPGETPLWREAIVTGLFDDRHGPDSLIEQIRDRLDVGSEQISIAPLPDRDWTRAWMDAYQPMQFGARLWVCPKHLEPPDPSAVNLRLDPGLAFGTGTHATTALCLGWLDAHVFPQCGYRKILDYGSGSGILAIAALLLGAEHADCVDIDEQALQATRDNARVNEVLHRVGTYTPAALDGGERYQLIMANILSGPLIELAPTLARFCDSGAAIVLSGILTDQAEAVREAYSAFFELGPTQSRDEWVLLHGTRHS